jgi:acetate kinase
LIGEANETLACTQLDAPQARVDLDELRRTLEDGGLGQADAVGHRIVHGGERFRSAVRIDPEVEAELRALTVLAPLHQPISLAAYDAVSRALPGPPAIACFDTAFHATLPPGAATYALPAAWRQRWGVRRYGFHGLSHAWIAHRAAEFVGADPDGLRIVSCHLGAGASLCAISDGRSIDTTMGFTPLEGLVMATRAGTVDPGLLLWLLEKDAGLGVRELSEALERESGLLGLAGTADMREIEVRAGAGDEDAVLALEVYLHRLCAAIGSMAAALGGLDVLAFTGGVGEHSGLVRAGAARGLAFLGVAIDEERNGAARADAELSAPGALVRTLVLAAREDLEVARQVRAVCGA